MSTILVLTNVVLYLITNVLKEIETHTIKMYEYAENEKVKSGEIPGSRDPDFQKRTISRRRAALPRIREVWSIRILEMPVIRDGKSILENVQPANSHCGPMENGQLTTFY